MIWIIVVLIIVQVFTVIQMRRAFRKWGYVTKEQGHHLTAINKILYLHERSLQNHRKALKHVQQNSTH